MDTVLLSPRKMEKTATSAAGVTIAICLLISQNLTISAKDIYSGAYTGLSPSLNYIKEEQRKREIDYKENIEKKYQGFKVVEVEKGVHHIKMIRYYKNQPVRINIVEISRNINSNINIEPTIASEKLNNRTKISRIAKREKAIVAINGGYFKPQTGVPLGTLMIDKEIYTGPIYNRVAMGISEDGYSMARVQLKAKVDTNIGGLNLDNINQPRMLATHAIVYTPLWGEYTPPTPKYGAQVVIQDGVLLKITEEQTKIPENGFVIVAPKQKLEKIKGAKRFKLNIKTTPDWKNIDHIISGGPYLVKSGDIYVDMTAQKLAAIGGRNPRTAIGYTKDNHLIMLTADGREGASIGLTLMELAELMKELDCVYAMNLDGGGSTVMYVNGEVVNKPAVQGGIPLSHTLTVTRKNIS